MAIDVEYVAVCADLTSARASRLIGRRNRDPGRREFYSHI
jgi:hypothetical protein